MAELGESLIRIHVEKMKEHLSHQLCNLPAVHFEVMGVATFSRLTRNLTDPLECGFRTEEVHQLHKIEIICSAPPSNKALPDLQIVRPVQ